MQQATQGSFWPVLVSARLAKPVRSQLVPVVTAVNPEALYLSENAMVVQLSNGTTPLKSFLTMEEDCGLLIPLAVPNSAHVTVWEEGVLGGNVYSLPFSPDKTFVMTGRSHLRMNSTDPLVCVIFCLARGNGGDESF